MAYTTLAALRSIPWDTLQAPTLLQPTQKYQGHLPSSGVQRHSADADYAAFGIVMIAHWNPTRPQILWEATQQGHHVISCPNYRATLAAARGLISA